MDISNSPLRTLAEDIVVQFSHLETQTRLEPSLAYLVTLVTDTSFRYNIWANNNRVFRLRSSLLKHHLQDSETLGTMRKWLLDMGEALTDGFALLSKQLPKAD